MGNEPRPFAQERIKQMHKANLVKLALLLLFNSFFHSSASAQFLGGLTDLPPTIENYPLQRLSERVYVVIGPHDWPNKKTKGFMNNPAAILTDAGFVIVDPGSSADVGRGFLEKLKCVSDKPVVAVFNTHLHGDHFLGNQGIRDAYSEVPIYAHQRTIDRLRSGEAQEWHDRFNGMTEGALASTRIAIPDKALKGGETMQIGGITLKIHHPGHAHSDTDLMIEVVEDKLMFMGDISMNKFMPYSAMPQDASFKGTASALRAAIDNTGVETYVPGHGYPEDKKSMAIQINFTEDLLASVKKYFLQGMQAHEMTAWVEKDMEAYRTWDHFDELGKVIAHAYVEVEDEHF